MKPDLSRALARQALPHVKPDDTYTLTGEELLQLKALTIQLGAMEQRARRRLDLVKDAAAALAFLVCAVLAALGHFYG